MLKLPFTPIANLFGKGSAKVAKTQLKYNYKKK